MRWFRRKRVLPEEPALPRLNVELSALEIRWIRLAKYTLMLATAAQLLLCGWWVWSSQSIEASSIAYEKAAIRTAALVRVIDDELSHNRSVFSADEIARVREEIVLANQLVDKRAFSWTQLLSDLEEAIPSDIALESIKPNFQEETVVLEGVARRFQDITALVQNLQDHRGFRQAVLTKHEFRGVSNRHTSVPRMSKAGGEASADISSVQFSLVAKYQPGS